MLGAAKAIFVLLTVTLVPLISMAPLLFIVIDAPPVVNVMSVPAVTFNTLPTSIV